MKNYEAYNFHESTLKFLEYNGFTEFFPIQEKVIPLALKHRDIIGISATGSGKTHAFLVPLMEIIDLDKPMVQAVITAPTRELAQQLFNAAKLMMKAEPRLIVKQISGGSSKERMSDSLKTQPHIIIGTPGRIKDLFLNEGTLLVQNAKVMVIDEGDMTLEYGFLNDIDAIAGRMNDDLQMMVFSATIPNGLKPFLKKYMKNPETVKVDEKASYNPHIRHILIPCKHKAPKERILDILPGFQPYICLIFANTREEADETAEILKDNGYRTLLLHGGLSSRERKQALNALNNHEYTYVVATDIASRGLDNDYITHVVSLGFPSELSFYVHRSGRTGRAGRDGVCYALYQDSDERSIRLLKEKGIKFEHKNFRNGEWSDLKPFGYKRVKKETELDKEISKIVKKETKVKPGYKKKREQEIEKLKRKKKREFIKGEIKKQQKERAKARQREKYDV
ncbi:MAG: DEAD/DEAH box helicase [Erysipelotrichaceae bacterium]|nr:DEAD/DEAH box helicase [Erysipelotrichaceae bacterium]